ncbi:threonine synthase [Halarcobacter ebronensis]|uniref:Threonine synthase n=1 Tax=Halarcobacter ebronensis TaxID=1462615 RepID=A0A4Q0YJ12_9BACT|nr:threonine synthase [Halarcobacter ebronensis]RXJ68871.1 threonine synthase [Halarcobacter ebronensis]
MNFIETRGNDGVKSKEVTFSEAILSPSASFGGLYVPKELPKLEENFILNHINSTYKELAYDILKAFEIDIEEEEIKKALDLYDKFDNPNNPCPVVKVKDDLFVHEQYHGPTRAFKDMALQPFGSILSSIAKKREEKYLILAATSGDTGPAALNTFKNKENIQVACLYPDGGTSDVQRLQMVCEDGKNLKVIGIKGNFDDAQTALKNLLASDSFKKELEKDNIKLSAANSVNFGRIIFQIIYHFWSYIQLIKQEEIKYGEKIYLVVPSGNFGNVLGGFYALQMGVPVEKLLVASNENKILTEWINTGIYDIRDKKLILTKSPAMDILKSSNIERVIYSICKAERTKELMEDLNRDKIFKMNEKETKELQKYFSAINSDDKFGAKIIKDFLNSNYLMDPHTATCIKAYQELKEKDLKVVIYSTAEWTKFSPTVLQALHENSTPVPDKEALETISKEYNTKLPSSIKELFSSEIKHKSVIEKEKIEEEIVRFIRE